MNYPVEQSPFTFNRTFIGSGFKITFHQPCFTSSTIPEEKPAGDNTNLIFNCKFIGSTNVKLISKIS